MHVEKERLYVVRLRQTDGKEFNVYPRASSENEAIEQAIHHYDIQPTVVSAALARKG